jgi:hypothetical protein
LSDIIHSYIKDCQALDAMFRTDIFSSVGFVRLVMESNPIGNGYCGMSVVESWPCVFFVGKFQVADFYL